MFINYSNHVSSGWDKNQIHAAEQYGEIHDMKFPNVPPDMDRDGVCALAEEEAKKILALKPDAVFCQGEMTLVYNLVNILKANGIKVVVGTTVRESEEQVNQDGSTVKVSRFRFVMFREY